VENYRVPFELALICPFIDCSSGGQAVMAGSNKEWRPPTMSATRLLVLAFVRAHGRAHGYLIGQDLLAWRANKWANTKTGSIYHALRQLTKEGLLSERALPGGQGSPARTDYAITKSGEAEFARLMEQALTQPESRPDMLCSGLVLMSALPRETVLGYLRRRREILEAQIKAVSEASETAEWTGQNALPPHVEALLTFWAHNTSSKHEWLEGLIQRIESGAYVFADEAPLAFGTPGSQVSRL
jgi:DNA-binding PadR family transcriptional regulator